MIYESRLSEQFVAEIEVNLSKEGKMSLTRVVGVPQKRICQARCL
jgi:hypothetical protein